MPSHTHNGAAITATQLQGSSLNQMNDDPPFVASFGESFYEAPGCRHVRNENVSKTEEAKFSAVFVIDDEVVKDGYDSLVVLDIEKEQK